MLRIGLTGGIGAGKSAVAARLAHHGAVVSDADQLAREVVAPGTDGLHEVVEAFGSGVLDAEGRLDRAALAATVFDDEPARRRLEEIVHPRVRALTAQRTAAAPADAIVVDDVPLLVESDLAATYHLVVVVEAAEETRLARLRDRGMSTAQARARITNQASDTHRRAAADVLLTNEGTRADLGTAVDALWQDRLQPFESNLRRGVRAARPPRAVVVDPDPDWPEHARRLMDRVRRVAGDRPRIDHIGSTAVPGLAAKDVVDVQVVVADLGTAGALAGDLTGAGLVRLSGAWSDRRRDGPGAHAKVMAGNADPGRPVNVHVRPAGSPAWRDALLLRDWLRATPSAVGEYAAVKRRLAAQPHESVEAYAESKSPWVDSALARADEWAAATGWQPRGQRLRGATRPDS